MTNLAEREKSALFPTYDRLSIGAVAHAEGVYITTESGQKYLDAIAGLGVNALGHSHPAIVQSIREQAGKYLHLSNLYLQEPQVTLAEKLNRASGWERVFFSNSGTEAVEGALKLARKVFSSAAKAEVWGIANGFHGRTYGPLSVMDKGKYRDGYGPFLADAGTLPSYDIATLEEHVTERTAAVIVEVIQGEGGIIEMPAEFVEALNALRDRHKFLIIADEIQSGIGRTGRFFAYEYFGLKPDIVVCAKAIGGGLPLGAILTRRELADAMKSGVHGTTFGGNPLACAAGGVVLDLVEKTYMDNASHEGEFMKRSLESLREKHPNSIREVRGKGLMLGIEFVANAHAVQKYLFDRHIISNVTGGEVLRLLPPLIFERKHSEELMSAIEEAVETID
jgi:acetylornithine/N-succinyldiaminopimelate aminotransferase